MPCFTAPRTFHTLWSGAFQVVLTSHDSQAAKLAFNLKTASIRHKKSISYPRERIKLGFSERPQEEL